MANVEVFDFRCNTNTLEECVRKLEDKKTYYAQIKDKFKSGYGLPTNNVLTNLQTDVNTLYNNIVKLHKFMDDYTKDVIAYEKIANKEKSEEMSADASPAQNRITKFATEYMYDETWTFDLGDLMAVEDLSGGTYDCGLDFNNYSITDTFKKVADFRNEFLGNLILFGTKIVDLTGDLIETEAKWVWYAEGAIAEACGDEETAEICQDLIANFELPDVTSTVEAKLEDVLGVDLNQSVYIPGLGEVKPVEMGAQWTFTLLEMTVCESCGIPPSVAFAVISGAQSGAGTLTELAQRDDFSFLSAQTTVAVATTTVSGAIQGAIEGKIDSIIGVEGCAPLQAITNAGYAWVETYIDDGLKILIYDNDYYYDENGNKVEIENWDFDGDGETTIEDYLNVFKAKFSDRNTFQNANMASVNALGGSIFSGLYNKTKSGTTEDAESNKTPEEIDDAETKPIDGDIDGEETPLSKPDVDEGETPSKISDSDDTEPISKPVDDAESGVAGAKDDLDTKPIDSDDTPSKSSDDDGTKSLADDVKSATDDVDSTSNRKSGLSDDDIVEIGKKVTNPNDETTLGDAIKGLSDAEISKLTDLLTPDEIVKGMDSLDAESKSKVEVDLAEKIVNGDVSSDILDMLDSKTRDRIVDAETKAKSDSRLVKDLKVADISDENSTDYKLVKTIEALESSHSDVDFSDMSISEINKKYASEIYEIEKQNYIDRVTSEDNYGWVLTKKSEVEIGEAFNKNPDNFKQADGSPFDVSTKWDSLTNEQKNQIFSNKDNASELKSAVKEYYNDIANGTIKKIENLKSSGMIKAEYSEADVLRMIQDGVDQRTYLTEEAVHAWEQKWSPNASGEVNVVVVQNSDNGVVSYSNSKGAGYGSVGKEGENYFVMPESEFNAMIEKCTRPDGTIDRALLTKETGGVTFPDGTDIVAVKRTVNIDDISLPQGNNSHSFLGQWCPGGSTSGGKTEGTINSTSFNGNTATEQSYSFTDSTGATKTYNSLNDGSSEVIVVEGDSTKIHNDIKNHK